MNWIILIIAGLCEIGFAFCLGKTKLIRTSQSWDGAELTCNNLNGFHVDNLSIMSR